MTSVNEEQEHKAVQISQVEHALKTNMWVGSKKLQTIETYVLNESKTAFELKPIKYAPAWYKIVDEVLVNAIDHWVNYPTKVTEIRLKFDKETGVVKVSNTGPSIGLYKVKLVDGREVYAPQAIASEFQTGSNFREERITGGTNGAGLKLANVLSKYMKIITLSNKDKKRYYQEFHCDLKEIHASEPILTPLKKAPDAPKTPDYTVVEFLPNYSMFGYNELTPDIMGQLDALIEARVYQASAYVKTPTKLYYNGNLITYGENSNFNSFVNMFFPGGEDEVIYTTLTPTLDADDNKSIAKKCKWDVCVAPSDGKFKNFSIVNGICVYNGGTHIKHLKDELVSAFKSKFEAKIKSAKFNPNYVSNNMFIFMRGAIINPEFPAQVKDTLGNPIETFSGYKFKTKDINAIWDVLEPYILSQFIEKTKDKKKTKVVRGRINNIDGATDALNAGHKTKWTKCTLIVAEGLSALGTVSQGIVNKNTPLDYDHYGTYSIQGVPLNVRKQISEFEDKKNNCKEIIRSEKLKDNKRFTDLARILGLDYNKKCTVGDPNGDVEYSTLRYGRVVCAVDQDFDGMGNIFGLIINFFATFWPELIKRDYVRRLNTPIIRAFPKGKNTIVKSFYTIRDYDSWLEKDYKDDQDALQKQYNIKYYKGLGTIGRKEIEPIFKDFEKNLFVYSFDEIAEQYLEVYYGRETVNRKEELRTPPDPSILTAYGTTNSVSITHLLKTDVKEYQRDNILRKLPHIMDGMVPVRRKILYASRAVFGASKLKNKEVKVCDFAGQVSSISKYHHGDASLNESIIKMAQDFPGARNLPMLIGLGNFGSRRFGGSDSASPRYTFLKLNQALCYAMFPMEDDWLLPYEFDDSERTEPSYYCGVLPVSVLESQELPATGWKIKAFSRDYKSVINNVRAMINEEAKLCEPMPVWLKGNNCSYHIDEDGVEHVVGKYEYDQKENTITITELPPWRFNSQYMEAVLGNKKGKAIKPEFTDKYVDNSNQDPNTNTYETKIRFELADGGYDAILRKAKPNTPAKQAVEEFMMLNMKLGHNLNMIDTNKKVVEFNAYEEIVNAWYPCRKALYEARIMRQIVICRLRIRLIENLLRYSKERSKYGITDNTELDVFVKILEDNKYDKFNKELLSNPKYTEASTIEEHVLKGSNSTYDYIIDLRQRDLLKDACQRRSDRLQDEKTKLNELLEDCEPGFVGRKTWLNEINALEKIIETGCKIGWNTDDLKYKY